MLLLVSLPNDLFGYPTTVLSAIKIASLAKLFVFGLPIIIATICNASAQFPLKAFVIVPVDATLGRQPTANSKSLAH